MTRYRVTVDYGDDRLRVYAVSASTPELAAQSVLDRGLLTVEAADDWEEHPEIEPDDEWEAENVDLSNDDG